MSFHFENFYTLTQVRITVDIQLLFPFSIHYKQCEKARTITCSGLTKTKRSNKVSVAKSVLPPLESPTAFATGKGIDFVYVSVSCEFFLQLQ